MNYIFLKKSLLYLLFIIFHLGAMEEKKEIQDLDSVVFSLNNLPDGFKTLPGELKHHCVKYIIKDKQLWYPIKSFSIQKEGYINSAHFNHDSSKIFYYISNLGTWKNDSFFKIFDINSGNDAIIPVPIGSEKIISNNSNTQYAIICATSITNNTNRINIVDVQTNSITSLFSNKNINSLQWNKDNTNIMDNNAIIWDIKTGEKTTILPQDYKSIDALWNNDNSLIASCNSCNDLDIWNIETKTLLTKLSGFVSNFKHICWNEDNIRIAFSNKKNTKDSRSIYIYNTKTGECLFELPLNIELGIQHACFWKNNSDIFIYKDDKIIVVNTITKELLSTIYNIRINTEKINELCFDNKGIYFFYIKDKNFLERKGFLWKQYTDFTLDQIFLYWLLHKWILIKKLKKDMSSIEQLLDDIIFYLPLNKVALLTIWNAFPEMVRKSLWKYKIRYFISG